MVYLLAIYHKCELHNSGTRGIIKTRQAPRTLRHHYFLKGKGLIVGYFCNFEWVQVIFFMTSVFDICQSQHSVGPGGYKGGLVRDLNPGPLAP